jgi:hypothetical protein
MAPPVYRSTTSLHPAGFGRLASPPPGKPRLAIVASNSRFCGVAAYSAVLRRQLADTFDITMFALDQYLMRSQHRRVRRLADRQVEEIAVALGAFDHVNLQLEYGTLGRYGSDIYRRFCWLSAAAPRLSVTFHSLLMPPHFDVASFTKALARFELRTAARIQADFCRGKRLSLGIARQLRRLQRKKPVSAIVHNRRDLSDVRYLYGLERVLDHPLAYLEPV